MFETSINLHQSISKVVLQIGKEGTEILGLY